MLEMIYKSTISLLIFFSSVFNCSSITENKLSQTQTTYEIIKVKLVYVNLFISTFSDVSCEDFEHFFQKNKQEKLITDTIEIMRIVDYIKDQKENDALNSIDTRFKIILYKSNQVDNDTICGSAVAIQANGKNYMINKDFQNYLRTLMQD